MRQQQDDMDPRRAVMLALMCLAALSVATALSQAGLGLTALALYAAALLVPLYFLFKYGRDHGDGDDHPRNHSGGSRLARVKAPIDD